MTEQNIPVIIISLQDPYVSQYPLILIYASGGKLQRKTRWRWNLEIWIDEICGEVTKAIDYTVHHHHQQQYKHFADAEDYRRTTTMANNI